jgi:hypothetical protein
LGNEMIVLEAAAGKARSRGELLTWRELYLRRVQVQVERSRKLRQYYEQPGQEG